MTGVGAALLFIWWHRGKTLKLDDIENQILQVAHQHNYQVTATQVAMSTDLSLEQATQRLEQMARKGIISVDVSPQGHLVYNFHQ
jgi:CTP-dependent riboflavin kinase